MYGSLFASTSGQTNNNKGICEFYILVHGMSLSTEQGQSKTRGMGQNKLFEVVPLNPGGEPYPPYFKLRKGKTIA